MFFDWVKKVENLLNKRVGVFDEGNLFVSKKKRLYCYETFTGLSGEKGFMEKCQCEVESQEFKVFASPLTLKPEKHFSRGNLTLTWVLLSRCNILTCDSDVLSLSLCDGEINLTAAVWTDLMIVALCPLLDVGTISHFESLLWTKLSKHKIKLGNFGTSPRKIDEIIKAFLTDKTFMPG